MREAARNRPVPFVDAGVSMHLGVLSLGPLMERMAEASGHELHDVASPPVYRAIVEVVFRASNDFDRLSFESPLDMKQRADALARPVHQAVLRTRGIEPLVSQDPDPAEGLLRLLEDLHGPE
jgi:hypothetical protein